MSLIWKYFGTAGLLLVWFSVGRAAETGGDSYYQAPTWQPRAILPTDDALRGDFWPASPAVQLNYDDPGFDSDRLSEVPPPGVHPRVLVTPSDIDRIRAKVALGDKAPLPFRALWARFSQNHNAFYALVTNDKVLGRQLAVELVGKIKRLEPKLDVLDQRADRDNLWAVERSTIASGDPDPPTEIWDLLDYDYLWQWMTPDEREQARHVIARVTNHRISNFMMVPDHFMTNNHQGFGMEYIRLMLLIEGEKGFDPKLFNLAAEKARAMLSWYLDGDGMCYESIKGWLNVSAFVAVGLRQRDLLKHDHLRAKMRFFQAALHWEDGEWKIRDEMRASAFHVIWMMHYYHPKDEGIDLLYRSTLTTHPFLTDPEAKWPNPVGICNELLLLYADDGMPGTDGKPIDWTDQARIDSLHLPLTWQDNQRGYVVTRNSWRKDDLHVGFACKQDFFYGGHEGSEDNRIILWKDGVNWIQDLNMLATKATFLQNMITVDGKGCHAPPAPGTWLGVQESPEGLVAAGDGKDGFSFAKVMQVHPLDFPSAKLGYYAPFAEGNYDLTRNQQVAYNPRTIKWNDGYAHTDYGPWSGETRLVEDYRPFNPMEQAYRTVHLARGENPYVLVFDDAKKDDQPHLFEWNISVPDDAVLVDAVTPEVVFQSSDPSAIRQDDLILGRGTTPRDPKTGKFAPAKGDPLCLIRVLWRNTQFGFPVPHLDHIEGFAHVSVPALGVSPEFRILVYPFKEGDPLPVTSWNRDRSQLTVAFKNQSDVYHLGQTDGGRTVFSMERNGRQVLASAATPARPRLLVRGDTFDASDLRYTRDDGRIPEYLVDRKVDVALLRPSHSGHIYYTLDGTDPTEKSTPYETSFAVTKSCRLKACLIDPSWTAGDPRSAIFAANFTLKSPDPGQAGPPEKSSPGLLARVYEIKTVMWNDKGFFDASKVMLPNVAAATPQAATTMAGFVLPHLGPTHPEEEQAKGFYRFTGWFQAPERGVYQFAVNSCGPVTLDVGQQRAISSIGILHQQQDVRRGEVVLEKGWHPLELVVCDPLFWNLNSLDLMPFDVSYRLDGGAVTPISASDLCYVPDAGLALQKEPEPAWHDAMQDVPMLETGLDREVYDRKGKRRAPDFLDVDGQEPYFSERTTEMEDNASPQSVVCYEGFFHAPTSGIYTFDLPRRNGESLGLGALQATCQNQLRLDGEVVVQRGVPGRFPLREVGLKAGWHTLSLRFGPSQAAGTVCYPDGQTSSLDGSLLSRPVLVAFAPDGKLTQRRQLEIYQSTPVTLSLPPGTQARIRYTLDGTVPDEKSPLYSGPIEVEKSTTLIAAGFDADHAVTRPAEVSLQRVETPQLGLVGRVDFTDWNGLWGPMKTGSGFGLWVAPDGIAVNGRGGKALSLFSSAPAIGSDDAPKVDVNVSRGATRAGFKVHHIAMRQNALTVAAWFKTSELTGKLFGKDGYNAFGKSYKTFSCSMDNGRLLASPGHLAGGKIEADTWSQVVLTADIHEMSLYLNGEKVATGPGTPDLTTDALDFFTDHPAVVESIAIYDRLLEPGEVAHLFASERGIAAR